MRLFGSNQVAEAAPKLSSKAVSRHRLVSSLRRLLGACSAVEWLTSRKLDILSATHSPSVRRGAEEDNEHIEAYEEGGAARK